MHDALEFIQAHGWEYKPGGGGFRIKRCPICGDEKWHFWMSPVGSTDCKKCNYKQPFRQFLRDTGETPIMTEQPINRPDNKPPAKPLSKDMEYHRDLLKSKTAIEYFVRRGLKNSDAYKHFKYGYHRQFIEGKEQDCITFPYYVAGELLNVKYRSIEGKSYGKVAGQPSSLFNIDAMDYSQPIIVTEGEIDAITAFIYGHKNVVSLPDGWSSWQECKTFFDSECEIIIATDMDEPGNKAAAGIAGLLGDYRCRRLELPHKDLNDCLQAGMTKEEIDDCFHSAKFMTRADMILIKNTIVQFLENLQNRGENTIRTGWYGLDRLTKGIRFNELTVLSGDSGKGKSTWATNIVFQLQERGVPCLIISSEIANYKTTSKMFGIRSGKQPWTSGNYELKKDVPVEYHITDAELSSAAAYVANMNVCYWVQGKPLPVESMKQYIKYCAVVTGVKFVVIDHLTHFLYHKDSKDELRETNVFTREMTQFAESQGIHILLIAHPGKGNKGKITMHDIKGSSSIYQDAHNVWLLLEEKEGETDRTLKICKARDECAECGIVDFQYDKYNFRYTCEFNGIWRKGK